MDFFADLFGLKRRRLPRIGTRWYIDLRVPDTPSYVGFFTRDVAVTGVRLEGESEAAFRRLLSAAGTVDLRIRVPGQPGTIEVVAELRWAMAGGEQFLTGWMFTDLADEAPLGSLAHLVSASFPLKILPSAVSR